MGHGQTASSGNPGGNHASTGAMYQLSGQHASLGQGLSISGASKAKMSQAAKPNSIAITGSTKRKTVSGTMGVDMGLQASSKVKMAGSQRSAQNQKVHVQQSQHPPQQALYS